MCIELITQKIISIFFFSHTITLYLLLPSSPPLPESGLPSGNFCCVGSSVYIGDAKSVTDQSPCPSASRGQSCSKSRLSTIITILLNQPETKGARSWNIFYRIIEGIKTKRYIFNIIIILAPIILNNIRDQHSLCISTKKIDLVKSRYCGVYLSVPRWFTVSCTLVCTIAIVSIFPLKFCIQHYYTKTTNLPNSCIQNNKVHKIKMRERKRK